MSRFHLYQGLDCKTSKHISCPSKLVYDRIPNIRPNIRSKSAEYSVPNIRPSLPIGRIPKIAENSWFLAIFHVKNLQKFWFFGIFLSYFYCNFKHQWKRFLKVLKCTWTTYISMIFLPFLYIISYFKKIKLFWPNFKVGIRPNIRPNIRRNLAEYSVSADTNFRPIGRSLIQILREINLREWKPTHGVEIT